jgi:hypothetical protein
MHTLEVQANGTAVIVFDKTYTDGLEYSEHLENFKS